jgi:SAM-dependent methyltransferase
VSALGLENVELVVGDVHDHETTLGGPFELAFTRCFLMHQLDPVQTLSRLAGLLRPGGWIVAHEPLRSPPPRSHPHLSALDDYWGLLHEVMELAGVPRGTVDGLPRSVRAARARRAVSSPP